LVGGAENAPTKSAVFCHLFTGIETYCEKTLWRPLSIQIDAWYTPKLLERSTKDMEIARLLKDT
jgi:hypothetical protein